MESRVNGVLINYVEHGDGIPLVALHGVRVDHREIEAPLEAIVPKQGYRRFYPDLPGMGGSTADGIESNEDVIAVLSDFIDQLDAGPALVLGHSSGAYLAAASPRTARRACVASRSCARSARVSRRCRNRRPSFRTLRRTTSSSQTSARVSTTTSWCVTPRFSSRKRGRA